MKAPQLKRQAQQGLKSGNRATILGALVLVVLLCGLLYFIYNRTISTDYEGRIVDRWTDYSESEQGSYPSYRLRVESDDGKRISVKVDPTVYESARVGMRIRSRSGQIVLIDQNSSTNK